MPTDHDTGPRPRHTVPGLRVNHVSLAPRTRANAGRQATRVTRTGLARSVVTVAICVTVAGCTSSARSLPSSTASPGSTTASAGSAGTGSAGAATPTAAGSAATLQSAYVSTIKQVLPSVVLIQTTTDLGSGVVFDTKGDIVTNDHVVGTATSFTVTLSGTTRALPATLVGTFPTDDLAVIKLTTPPAALRPARFGDSDTLQVGDIVLAMGNPLGLASSVTNGIVSAVGRVVAEPKGTDSPGATLPDTIQTSAAINPGNSGGALVDLAGQVVGIPTLAALDSQEGGGAAPGIGFAISSNIVTNIAAQIVRYGRVVDSHRAALGITATSQTTASGQAAGAGVYSVTPGGAAARAGLARGDVILSVAGKATPTTAALSSVLATLKVGQKVLVKYDTTTGTAATVTVTLGSLPG